MKMIDNKSVTLKEDLIETINKGSKVSIAASCFSIYAFQELKKELEGIEELRFVFTSPTFTTEKAAKEKREFYIPRLGREKSLYGTEFEVKLRNELTQKAIAKECAEWIRAKVTFKSNVTSEYMQGLMNVDEFSYTPLNGFTTVDLGCERGNNVYNFIIKNGAPESAQLLTLFDEIWSDKNRLQDVTDVVLDNITAAYNENSPEFIYFVTLYNIFNEFLEDVSEDVLPNEATGFKDSQIWGLLYDFQKDAALAIINKLEKYNGCILADSVGLGKTFTALSVIKYYENRNKTVLVLCPKKLAENWNTFKGNYLNNPVAKDRLRYDVLYHTDLNRERGVSNGVELDRLNWSNYDLVVIDESHNFRNGGKLSGEDNEKENRYLKLLNKVIRKGVKTKVLMLSATPVNNRFNDLKNQLALAYEGDSGEIDTKLNTKRSIDEIFKNAQKAFNTWSKWELEDRTTENLLRMLDFDFFEVLDSVTIARSRKHIQKYYDTSKIGVFPKRLKPISMRPCLTDIGEAISYNEIFEKLTMLNLAIYTPFEYIQPSAMPKYAELYGDNEVAIGFTQANREKGIRRLMAINLMKRMESSVYSFKLTLERIKESIDDMVSSINDFDDGVSRNSNFVNYSSFGDDMDEEGFDESEGFTFGKKVKIDLKDMDYVSWRHELMSDVVILEGLLDAIEPITPEHDSKLQELLDLVDEKITHPINDGNKKIIIFTAFSDTADYLYKNVSKYIFAKHGLNTAIVTGSVDGRSTVPRLHCDMNTVLTCFSPLSKDKKLLMPDDNNDIDILIATDCISEGQNLQDCDYLINYDIHWNPVRIIQRFGRIDRIGSKNEVIQLVNFWPDVTLDEYINLKAKVETRMKIVDMAATGDDNILNDEQKVDLEYRKEQLKRLQDEVVDIEDVSSGVSIMDLGLNEFRLDLLDYVKNHPDLDKAPFGLHAVTSSEDGLPEGIIFVLKNLDKSVSVESQNRIHPFYMVYIDMDGGVVCDYLDPKKLLDDMRLLCKGKYEPISGLCGEFNRETSNGQNMSFASELLSDAIASIIDKKDESDIDSLFSTGGTTALVNDVNGLDDFELICFLVVK